jgi:hypothetical protein
LRALTEGDPLADTHRTMDKWVEQNWVALKTQMRTFPALKAYVEACQRPTRQRHMPLLFATTKVPVEVQHFDPRPSCTEWRACCRPASPSGW